MDNKLSDLTTIPSIDRATDLLYVVDMPGEVSYKATPNEVLGITGNPVGHTDTQTLTNKTLTSPTITTPTLTVNDNALTLQDNSDTTKKAVFELSGITAGQTRTLTVPDASTTLVGTGVTQTLTNKTLTAPTITNPTLTVDTISEFTGANGVTIDGLNIKDSKLNTNNSVVTANITDASVTNPKLGNSGSFDSSWLWASWTPTWGGITVGNAVVNARYSVFGKTVVCRVGFTLGTTSAMIGLVTFTLPVTANAVYTGTSIYGVGTCHILDSGTQTYQGNLELASTTQCRILAWNTAGTYSSASGFTSTVPFTWTTGDMFNGTLVYESV